MRDLQVTYTEEYPRAVIDNMRTWATDFAVPWFEEITEALRTFNETVITDYAEVMMKPPMGNRITRSRHLQKKRDYQVKFAAWYAVRRKQ